MLYSIIPPIIVILSFIAVIVFLSRKASKVADLREISKEGIGENYSNKLSFFKPFTFKTDFLFSFGFKVWLWSFLEKLTRKSRMEFLKLESFFSKISNKIKEKKDRKKNEFKTEEKIKNITQEKKEGIYDFSSLRKNPPSESFEIEKDKPEDSEFKEKPVKPIISDKIVSPRNRSEIKDILEDVLIERIAANPKDVEAYERLGEYYTEIGNYEHAKECMKQIIKLNPANKSAKYKMRRLEGLMNN